MASTEPANRAISPEDLEHVTRLIAPCMSMWQGTRILVTGASGFIGPAIVRELLARGHRLRLALRRADPVSLFGDRVSKAAIADLAKPIDWSPLLDGVEGLVHAAGVAHAGTRNVSSYLFAVNAEATDRLMRAAMRAGVSRVVYISSVRAIARRIADS